MIDAPGLKIKDGGGATAEQNDGGDQRLLPAKGHGCPRRDDQINHTEPNWRQKDRYFLAEGGADERLRYRHGRSKRQICNAGPMDIADRMSC